MAEPLVLGLVPDLMFATRIRNTAAGLGYRAEVVPSVAALLERARDAAPALILVDLAARGVESAAAIQALKADPAARTIPVVAFGPHLDESARDAARAAGADAVVANSKLALDLPGLLSRYARPAPLRAGPPGTEVKE
jgi:CheY-like chemotaxis protein